MAEHTKVYGVCENKCLVPTYSKTEIDNKLNGKSNTDHTHDDRYYTETEINNKLNGKSNTNHTHDVLVSSDGIGKVHLWKYENGGYKVEPANGQKLILGSSNIPLEQVTTKAVNVTEKKITCKPTYDGTSTYAPNIYVGTTGIFSRSTNTSSKTIKHDIKALEKNTSLSAENLYNVKVVQFKYNEGIITDENDNRYNKDLVGFIIENLNDAYPIAVDKPSGNVKEWSWNSQYLIPPMLKLIQDQKKEIDELKKEISEIKGILKK